MGDGLGASEHSEGHFGCKWLPWGSSAGYHQLAPHENPPLAALPRGSAHHHHRHHRLPGPGIVSLIEPAPATCFSGVLGDYRRQSGLAGYKTGGPLSFVTCRRMGLSSSDMSPNAVLVRASAVRAAFLNGVYSPSC